MAYYQPRPDLPQGLKNYRPDKLGRSEIGTHAEIFRSRISKADTQIADLNDTEDNLGENESDVGISPVNTGLLVRLVKHDSEYPPPINSTSHVTVDCIGYS